MEKDREDEYKRQRFRISMREQKGSQRQPFQNQHAANMVINSRSPFSSISFAGASSALFPSDKNSSKRGCWHKSRAALEMQFVVVSARYGRSL